MKTNQDDQEYCVGIACVALFTIYMFCMVLVPTFSNWNQSNTWREVQNIWDRWQTFNASMIALLASAIAIYSTIYKDRAEKQRNFIAERAYLPHALSDFSEYIQNCARFYVAILEQLQDKKEVMFYTELEIPNGPPDLSNESMQAAKSCIKYAEHKEAQHLSIIMHELQVIKSNINSHFPPLDGNIASKRAALNRLYYLASSHDRIQNTFDFARGGELKDYVPPSDERKQSICMHYFNMHYWHFDDENFPFSNSQ